MPVYTMPVVLETERELTAKERQDVARRIQRILNQIYMDNALAAGTPGSDRPMAAIKPLAVHPELSDLPMDDLTTAQRLQGCVPSTWSESDVIPLIEADAEAADLSEDELTDGAILTMAEELLSRVANGLQERLSSYGNDILDELWRQHRNEIIDEVLGDRPEVADRLRRLGTDEDLSP